MLARENMKSLSEVFTEGARAEVKIAQRQSRNVTAMASAHIPNYAAVLKKTHAAIAPAAVMKTNGELAHVMQPVVSAADRYRKARLNGELPDAATASAAAAADAVVAPTTKGKDFTSIPLFLILGLGSGGAYAVHEGYGFFGIPATATATAARIDTYPSIPPTTIASTATVEVAVRKRNDTTQQPLWLQRQR